jgi:hypothetical protein
MRTIEDDLTKEPAPKQEESPGANLAKKTIDTVRENLLPKRAAPICRTCGLQHWPGQFCVPSNKNVNSEMLTSKAIDALCGTVPAAKAALKRNLCEDAVQPSQTRVYIPKQSECEATEQVRAYADALQETKEKLEAEERARAGAQEQAKAESEARAKLEAEAQEKAGAYAAQIARMQAALEAEREARIAAEEKIRAYAEQVRTKVEAARAELESIDIPSVPAAAATCECCCRQDVLEDQLVRIDSGQLLCEHCIMELRRPRQN